VRVNLKPFSAILWRQLHYGTCKFRTYSMKRWRRIQLETDWSDSIISISVRSGISITPLLRFNHNPPVLRSSAIIDLNFPFELSVSQLHERLSSPFYNILCSSILFVIPLTHLSKSAPICMGCDSTLVFLSYFIAHVRLLSFSFPCLSLGIQVVFELLLSR